jgi:hypothetical protein
MSSYEDYCNDYALHGDPERDHWDYEENSAYDRYDGWDDHDPQPDDVPCDVCGYNYDCADCVKSREEWRRAARDAYEASLASDVCDDDVPF